MTRTILFASFLLSTNVFAQCPPDHLVPEEGIFAPVDSSYNLQVAQQLLPKLSYKTEFTVIVIPSFSPEWSVSVSGTSGAVWVARAPRSIFHSQGKPTSKPKEDSVQLPIDLARRVVALVNSHLDHVRYSVEPNYGLDGETYHFVAQRRGEGIRAGKTWSPDRGAVASLVDVIQILRQFTVTETSERNAILKSLTSALADAEQALQSGIK